MQAGIDNPFALLCRCGIPITIVLTKTDRLDSVGDELVSRGLVKGKGLTSAPGKGGSQNAYSAWNWDERVDWGLAVVRVVALMCESFGVGRRAG